MSSDAIAVVDCFRGRRVLCARSPICSPVKCRSSSGQGPSAFPLSPHCPAEASRQSSCPTSTLDDASWHATGSAHTCWLIQPIIGVRRLPQSPRRTQVAGPGRGVRMRRSTGSHRQIVGPRRVRGPGSTAQAAGTPGTRSTYTEGDPQRVDPAVRRRPNATGLVRRARRRRRRTARPDAQRRPHVGLDEVPDAIEQARRARGPPRVVVHPNGDVPMTDRDEIVELTVRYATAIDVLHHPADQGYSPMTPRWTTAKSARPT